MAEAEHREPPAVLKVEEGHPFMLLVSQRVKVGPPEASRWLDMTRLRAENGVRTALDFLAFARAFWGSEPTVSQELEALIDPSERGPGNGILLAVLDPSWEKPVRFLASSMFARPGLAVLALDNQATQAQIRESLDSVVPAIVEQGLVNAAMGRKKAVDADRMASAKRTIIDRIVGGPR